MRNCFLCGKDIKEIKSQNTCEHKINSFKKENSRHVLTECEACSNGAFDISCNDCGNIVISYPCLASLLLNEETKENILNHKEIITHICMENINKYFRMKEVKNSTKS
jgi:hypothetical protein